MELASCRHQKAQNFEVASPVSDPDCLPHVDDHNFVHIKQKLMFDTTIAQFKIQYALHHFHGYINPLTPNDPYRGRTAPLTSKRCILYIYSTNKSTEYFKHGINSPFFSLQNGVCFIMLTYLVPVLFTFYIQGVLKLQK